MKKLFLLLLSTALFSCNLEPQSEMVSEAGDSFESSDNLIKVKFQVKNGNIGLIRSWGLVADWNLNNVFRGTGVCANDYWINVLVPKYSAYISVYWMGYAGVNYYYGKGKIFINNETKKIVLDIKHSSSKGPTMTVNGSEILYFEADFPYSIHHPQPEFTLLYDRSWELEN